MTQIYNIDPAGGVKLAVVRVCVLFFTAAGVDESRAKPMIVKVWALEVPPPGAGFTTVTWAVPPTAMSAAVIAAVNWVEETYVVVRFDPFQLTVEPETKPVPFTVSVNPAPPAVVEAGLRPVVAGTGLLILTVTVRIDDSITPP
jgi:hypothetical protein